jgi:hypothetical protein
MELVEVNIGDGGIGKVPEALKERADLDVRTGIFYEGGEGEGTENGGIIEVGLGR